MKHLYLLTLIFCFCFFSIQNSRGQAPTIQWQSTVGGTAYDQAESVIQTFDGGFVATGISTSTDGDVTNNHGAGDVWVIKLNPSGVLQWEKSYGGSGDDGAFAIAQTADSGFVIAASSTSADGDVTANHGFTDWWIIKLDSTGLLQWQKTFGGSLDDIPYAIEQTNDMGFIISGYTISSDGDITLNHGFEDCWVVKLDNSGAIQWQKTFGGSQDERSFSIKQTSDSGYITAGYAKSNDGDVAGNHGDYDYWVIKLSNNGALQWQKPLGGSSLDKGHSVAQTLDGGYITAGLTASADGDVTTNNGSEDLWIAKLNSLGILQWQKSFGGSGVDQAFDVRQLQNGDYLLGGSSYSLNGDVTGNHGGYDDWIVKSDSTGNIIWEESLGGSSIEECYSISPTADSGYVIAGGSLSNDGNVTGNHGDFDYWIVKLNETPTSVDAIANRKSGLRIFPNPSSGRVTINYTLSSRTHVALEVFNSDGQKIMTLSNGIADEGKISDPESLDLPVGIYTIRLVEDERVLHAKLIVAK
jgi:hypothetical protein